MINHGVEFKSVIAPIAKFGKIAREMPAADGVIGAPQGILREMSENLKERE